MLSRSLSTSGESYRNDDLSVRSVNWHVWPFCNYHCKFCFARFDNDSPLASNLDEGIDLLSRLADEGMEKITFVGGEPMLCPYLGEYIEHAKDIGCLTMVVSNGSLIIERFLERYYHSLDWIGLSMDSSNESTERVLGRGNGNHLINLVNVAKAAHEHDIKLKLNVTITKLILQEDLHEFVKRIQPGRLKFFQVLSVRGQNDIVIDEFAVSREEFYQFVDHHSDLNPVVEDNRMMTGSYVMIDPMGRFFQNIHGTYKYSSPIQEIGVLEALRQVGFSWKKLVERGGSEYFSSDSSDIISHSHSMLIGG